MAGVAQLVRAPDCDSGGRGFEPRFSPHFLIDTYMKDQDTSPQEETLEEAPAMPEEHGGPKGLEPTRYGDWEKNGRVSDF